MWIIRGSEKPHLIAALSFVIRAAVVLGAFYLLVTADWTYLLTALAGFLIARVYLTYRFKPERK